MPATRSSRSTTEQQLGHEDAVVPSMRRSPSTARKWMPRPAGTLVYLDDVTERRHAVAIEPGTTALAIGGFDLVVSS